jgi:glyoxylase-like metal-dependent hydrolase (beta-lactamase superfamily II)
MHVSKFARLCSIILLSGAALAAHAADSSIRLYVLDCGRIEFKDMSMFSDTGEYDGKSGKLVDSCYLIRHPQGTLLWDTGLGDKIADQKGGVDNNGIHMYVDVTLQDQLKALNLTPQDITLLAFSHFHFDHTGNANLFTNATWILNSEELAGALAPKPTIAEDASLLSGREQAKTQMIDGDYDVFGDGSVKILKAPGHTPGHQVLEVKLAKSGTVILGGDLYHTRDNRKERRVPLINTSRADTLASMDRIERIVKNTHARFIMQHNPEDVASLPKPPAYLD